MLDQQAAHAELDPIPLVGGNPPLPERLGDDAEHRAAVELLAAGLNRVDAQAAQLPRLHRPHEMIRLGGRLLPANEDRIRFATHAVVSFETG